MLIRNRYTSWINTLLCKFISLNLNTKQNILKIFSYLPLFLKKIIVSVYIKKRKEKLCVGQWPDTLYFFVTNSCNMRCKHCFYIGEISSSSSSSSSSCKELDVSEIERIAYSIKGVVKNFIITGGEPFIRKDLDEICSIIVEKGDVNSLALATNGFLTDRIIDFTKRFLEQYPEINLDLQISLDGPKSTHDKLRNLSGAFDHAIRTIHELEDLKRSNSKLNVVINTVVSKYNIDVMPDFYQFVLRNFNVNYMWHFLRQDAIDVNCINPEELLAYKDSSSFNKSKIENLLPAREICEKFMDFTAGIEGDNLLTEWRMLLKKYHLDISFNRERAVEKCIALYKGAVLFPDGGVSICEVLKPAANVKDFEYDYLQSWRSADLDKQRKTASQCFCTYPCYLMDSMLYDQETILSIVGNH